MTAWYSAPQSLAPQGASPGGTSGVSGGTGRCPTCPAANARQRGRRAARAPSATSRSRAKGGVSSTAIALRCAVDRAGPTTVSGVQGATGRGARSRAGRRGNPKSCPEPGRRTKAGAPNGWRDRCRRDTPRPPHATAREHASKGRCRNLLRDPNDLPGRERIAHHNLAASTGSPRPPGAAGGHAGVNVNLRLHALGNQGELLSNARSLVRRRAKSPTLAERLSTCQTTRRRATLPGPLGPEAPPPIRTAEPIMRMTR